MCFFILLLSVPARHNFNKCVAGDSLYIQLEGLDLSDTTLFFSGEAGNFTLVKWLDGLVDGMMDGWIK